MKDKALKIVKNYNLILGWVIISPMLLIPGYMINSRIKEKKPAVGPMIASAIIWGLLSLIGLIIVIAASINSGQAVMGLIILVFYFLICGIPFLYSILYLIEEKKTPTIRVSDIAQKIRELNSLLNQRLITDEEYEQRKKIILESI